MNKISNSVDLRSDTLTKPSKEMLEAMLTARVGDDVFNEDPTVTLLQNVLAEQFGMEAALFCPSGTMANQIAIKMHTQALDEVICDKLSHIYYYETAGFAFNSRCSIRLIDGDLGRISPSQIKESIQADFDWLPVSKLVVVENSCNKGGGSVYTLKQLQDIAALCKKQKLKLHLDGARFFNAMIATNTKPTDYKGLFDSISICLSKGLGAPIGSVLLSNKKTIKRARKIRKVLGGGMRQVGILAAAGLYALSHNIKKLAKDHEHAKEIASCLADCTYVKKIVTPSTNIVLFDLENEHKMLAFLNYLKKHDILAVPFGKQTVRFVFHLDILSHDIPKIKETLLAYKD